MNFPFYFLTLSNIINSLSLSHSLTLSYFKLVWCHCHLLFQTKNKMNHERNKTKRMKRIAKNNPFRSNEDIVRRFHSLFHSLWSLCTNANLPKQKCEVHVLWRVLFIVPLRYLFTIGFRCMFKHQYLGFDVSLPPPNYLCCSPKQHDSGATITHYALSSNNEWLRKLNVFYFSDSVTKRCNKNKKTKHQHSFSMLLSFPLSLQKQSKKHWKKNTHIHSTQKDWMYARVNSSNIFFSAP